MCFDTKPGSQFPQSDISHPDRKAMIAIAWPYCAGDGQPLAWWRMLPADLFGHAERLGVRETLECLAVVDGSRRFAVALKVDPVAAITLSLSLPAIPDASLKVDIAVTVLLRNALNDPGAALVLSDVLEQTELQETVAADLATSWPTRHLCASQEARLLSARTQAILSSALTQAKN